MFKPKFQTWYDYEMVVDAGLLFLAANKINLPHEDYPDRVPATLKAIKLFIEYLENGGMLFDELTQMDIRQIHHMVFEDTYHAGSYRDITVTVGGNKTPDPAFIPALLDPLFPVGPQSDLEKWYKEFEECHCFVDGNGRVGGIVLAVLSYIRSNGESILVPCQ